jgi:tetratricopeptide (TPR) repeat protein
MDKHQKIEKLMDEGFEALYSFNSDKAIIIGKKLKQLRHSSAFEILALGYNQIDKPEKSIEVLKEGVSVAPDVWLLWQLLGNYQSDTENFAEAQRCYCEALKCKGNDANAIKYNSAIAYSREKKYSDAETQINSIDFNQLENDVNYKLLILSYAEKICIQNKLGKLIKAFELGKEVLVAKYDVDDFRDELAVLYTSHAETLYQMKQNKKALEYLWYSVELDKKNKRTSSLIREIENRFSKNTKYYRIMIQGVWPEPFEGESIKPGFFTSYDVVADDNEQAFELIKRFEPDYVQGSLKIVESEVLEERPNEPIGIYSAGSYSFFTE